MAVETTELDQERHGLDRLEVPQTARRPRPARAWSATWPKLGAVALALATWQVVVWSGWKPDYLLPGPATVLGQLGEMATEGSLADAVRTTLGRAAAGFLLALGIGVAMGAVVSRIGVARSAFGSLITGLQTMPSVPGSPLPSSCSPSTWSSRSFSSSCSAPLRRSPTGSSPGSTTSPRCGCEPAMCSAPEDCRCSAM